MSGYGPPPSAPPTSSGASGLGLPAILGYAAGGLGVLTFIWGFLDFYSPSDGGGDGVSGYASGAAGVLALTVFAGLVAAGEVFEKKPTSLLAVAPAVAGLLIVFGATVDTQSGADASVGLILSLISAILQAGVLVYAWLIATGKLSAPQPKPQAPQSYAPPQGYGAPQGYGPPQGGPSGPPPGYGAPQGPPSGPPQGPPPGAPQGGGYGAPSSYGSPQQGPSGPPQGPPPGYGAPQRPPSGGPSSPPPPPPPPSGNPYSPPPGN